MENDKYIHGQVQLKVMESVQAQMEQIVKDSQELLNKMTVQNEKMRHLLDMMK